MHSTGYRALALYGTEYVRRVLRRESPVLDMPLGSFAAELGMALRPHFFALSSVAALAGASAMSTPPGAVDRASGGITARIVLAAVVAGLGWGVGQLLNDLLDRESDRTNSPDRAIVAGRLPAGPALVFAALLGLLLAIALLLVDPREWILVVLAAVLLICYNAAKKWPVAGQAAHGSLMAVAAAVGAGAALPAPSPIPSNALSFLRDLSPGWRTFAAVGALAAWYLQSNYEKDRPGDREAGYRTLAVVLSVRASATLRAVAIVAIGLEACAAGLLPEPVSQSTMIAGVVLGVASTFVPISRGTDEAALRAYRASVPASILAMLSLAAPLLGRWATTVVLVVALVLVWAAFRRSPNP